MLFAGILAFGALAAMPQVAPAFASGQGTIYQEVQGYYNASGCQTQDGVQVCASQSNGVTTVTTQNNDVPTFTITATPNGCPGGYTEYTVSQSNVQHSFCPANTYTDPTLTYSFSVSDCGGGNLCGSGSGSFTPCAYGQMTSSSSDSGFISQSNVDTLSWNDGGFSGVSVWSYQTGNLCIPVVFFSGSYTVTDTGGDSIGPVFTGNSGNTNLNLVPEAMTVTTTIDASYVIFFGGF